MQTWYANVGSGGCGITLEIKPWYKVFISWLTQDMCCWLGLHHIPLPDAPKIKWEEDDEELYTPKEYYGDLGMWFCSEILYKIFNWCDHTAKYHCLPGIPFEEIKDFLSAYDRKWIAESLKQDTNETQ